VNSSCKEAERAHWQGAAIRAQVPALLKGTDLRPERPAHVAEPHPPTRPNLPLLPDPRGDRGWVRYLSGDQRARR
jgi:hypothetical protein